MTESPYSFIDRCMETLNLDFSSEEFARLAAETAMSPESIAAVNAVFEYLETESMSIEFSAPRFNAMVDRVDVFPDGRMVFRFVCGREIAVGGS